jgi:hypothetical protein
VCEAKQSKILIARTMKTYNIKTYRNGNEIIKPHFFILNKGMNSGKPLDIPCTNCFTFSCSSETDKDFYYWLLFGLWRTKLFHPFLRGTVIPFITLSDLCKCIQTGTEHANQDLKRFNKHIEALKFLDLKEKQFHQNLQLIDDTRKMIFYEYRRRQF